MVTRKLVWGCVLALEAFALLAVAVPTSSASLRERSHARHGTTFNLRATTGRISTPDGSSVFMWGFAKNPGSFQMPGPILCVTQGGHRHRQPPQQPRRAVSIVFPGQDGRQRDGRRARPVRE